MSEPWPLHEGRWDTNRELLVPPRTLVHTDDIATSHDAAAANQEVKGAHRRLCLEAHRADPDGLTDQDVSDITGLELIEARRRCSDLRNLGLIRWLRDDEGRVLTMPTRLGRRGGICVPIGPPDG